MVGIKDGVSDGDEVRGGAPPSGVGPALGILLGAVLGTPLGAALGTLEGALVAPSKVGNVDVVGMNVEAGTVGMLVGEPDGMFDGVDVGKLEGMLDGASVGPSVGTAEIVGVVVGLMVGVDDGTAEIVGVPVGLMVGVDVVAVGATVGAIAGVFIPFFGPILIRIRIPFFDMFAFIPFLLSFAL
jgi:hypothetical protein